MRTTTIEMEKINLRDLLTVDTHGEEIRIEDKNAQTTFPLIPDRYTFFNDIFASVEENGLKIINGANKKIASLDEFLELLDKKRNSCVVLIEGFAGCGKSTLVQYILWKQLQTPNYDYNFYNYDLESQNDLIIRNDIGEKVRKSSIFEAIRKSFCEQFIKIASINKEVIEVFYRIIMECENFQPFNDLYYKFANTNTFDEIMNHVSEGISDMNKHTVKRKVFSQSEAITSSSCLLALDYILRIAMYIKKVIKKLYICYDNLDAIEDAEDLNAFDDNLNKFRSILDNFIVVLQSKQFFKNMEKPYFIMIATYRKITASMANIRQTSYKEVQIDKIADSKLDDYVYHLDTTSAFSYKKIVKRRKDYFNHYLKNANCITNEQRQKLKKQFLSWYNLNQNLEIMNNRYACLWNKNYRTCSLIANELFSKPQYDFDECVEFVKNAKKTNNKISVYEYNKMDGYDSINDKDGNKVLCTYYGGSAILLSNICKVFNDNGIWNDFLNLTSLHNTEHSYKNVSLSRLILTFLYNKQSEVSLSELYDIFCSKELFSCEELCTCLANMLARNLHGVWRRPIYYFKEIIISTQACDIKKILLKECEYLKERKNSANNYRFLLCDSGYAYVERLMQEFEFFSNRLSNDNKSLYLYNCIEDISKNIEMVYNAVRHCCNNMADFKKKYIDLNHITDEEYLVLPIHPTTNSKSPQLHTERTIFSHIAYLNNVRLYYLDENTISNINTRKEYNKVFVDYIEKYLNLYYAHIKPQTAQRQQIAEDLKEIIKDIKNAIKLNTNDISILFRTISLRK